MAGIDASGHGRRRANNHDIPLIPFIDFLLCLVMFLLVTAVWSELSRLEADAQVLGQNDSNTVSKPEPELHVDMTSDSRFELKWQEGSTVTHTLSVPRNAKLTGEDVSYPELQSSIAKQVESRPGVHKSETDLARTRAVLHTDSSTEFAHIAAVLDAITGATRKLRVGTKSVDIPVFQVALANN